MYLVYHIWVQHAKILKNVSMEFVLVSFDQIFTALNMAKTQISWLQLQATQNKSAFCILLTCQSLGFHVE